MLTQASHPARWSRALNVGRLALCAAVLSAPAARASVLGGVAIDSYAPTPDPSSVGGRASLDLNLAGLQTSVQAAVEGGGAAVATDPFAPAASDGQSWTGNHAKLTTVWTPTPGARLEIEVSDQSKQALARLDPLAPGLPGQMTNTQSESAKMTAVLAPLASVEVRLGGEATSALAQTPAYPVAGVLTAGSDLRNDTSRLFADLTWTPAPRLSLQAGEAMESLGVGAGPASDSAAYAYLTPRVAAVLTPWSDATWTISAERAVTAPNAAQFASFIQTADHPAAGAFQPDHEWRYVASVKQTLAGGVLLSASVTQSELQSVTDLGPVGAAQAPVDIGAGARRKIDLSLSAPLALPGLPPAKLSASAAWTASQVTDPFTGQRRPISGDAAYSAELNLSGALARAPLSWALKARLTGPQSVYQMSQVDLISPTAGLGGAINYKAGPVTLGLNLDNIVGGGRTDTSLIYAGSRAFDLQDGARQTHDDSRAVRFSLTRAL